LLYDVKFFYIITTDCCDIDIITAQIIVKIFFIIHYNILLSTLNFAPFNKVITLAKASRLTEGLRRIHAANKKEHKVNYALLNFGFHFAIVARP
jgi:hypothetical protein